ncbi:MAG: hypothetical protein K5Q68_04185 [Roseococcus sp.]|nr:hypothetical protein [Roseococcus sp.]
MIPAAFRLLCALALLGLGWPPADATAQGRPTPEAGVVVLDDHAAHDRIAALSLRDQRAALLPLIRATDGGCEDLSGAYFAGIDAAGRAYWDVRCQDRTAWRIAPSRDGGVADLILCPRQSGTCFQPLPRRPGDLGAMLQARCSAACELRSGPMRQACIARCLQGNEGVAGAGGGGGHDRYLAIFVVDLPRMTEGFRAGGRSAALAQQTARSACTAVASAAACRLAVAAFNACVAVVQVPNGLIHTATGMELDDAEREAQASCGRGATCHVTVSGC